MSHAATSTQTVAAIKKKSPFDEATGALSKLAIGKKMRTVNPRVPPNANSHAKEDGSNPARKYFIVNSSLQKLICIIYMIYVSKIMRHV